MEPEENFEKDLENYFEGLNDKSPDDRYNDKLISGILKDDRIKDIGQSQAKFNRSLKFSDRLTKLFHPPALRWGFSIAILIIIFVSGYFIYFGSKPESKPIIISSGKMPDQNTPQRNMNGKVDQAPTENIVSKEIDFMVLRLNSRAFDNSSKKVQSGDQDLQKILVNVIRTRLESNRISFEVKNKTTFRTDWFRQNGKLSRLVIEPKAKDQTGYAFLIESKPAETGLSYTDLPDMNYFQNLAREIKADYYSKVEKIQLK